MLGVEMSSTGEVACFGNTAHDAFLKALLSTGFKLPEKTMNVLLSIAHESFLKEFLDAAKIMQGLGYNLFGTPGTAKYYADNGVKIESLEKPELDVDEGEEAGALKEIRDGNIDMVINVPEGTNRKDDITAGYMMRRAAVDFGASLITNIKCAVMLAEALAEPQTGEIQHIGEFHSMKAMQGMQI